MSIAFTQFELMIEKFWWDAIAGTIIISIVSAVLGLFVKSGNEVEAREFNTSH